MLYEVLKHKVRTRCPNSRIQLYGVLSPPHWTYEETESIERLMKLPRSPDQVPEELPSLTLSGIFGLSLVRRQL